MPQEISPYLAWVANGLVTYSLGKIVHKKLLSNIRPPGPVTRPKVVTLTTMSQPRFVSLFEQIYGISAGRCMRYGIIAALLMTYFTITNTWYVMLFDIITGEEKERELYRMVQARIAILQKTADKKLDLYFNKFLESTL